MQIANLPLIIYRKFHTGNISAIQKLAAKIFPENHKLLNLMKIGDKVGHAVNQILDCRRLHFGEYF